MLAVRFIYTILFCTHSNITFVMGLSEPLAVMHAGMSPSSNSRKCAGEGNIEIDTKTDAIQKVSLVPTM